MWLSIIYAAMQAKCQIDITEYTRLYIEILSALTVEATICFASQNHYLLWQSSSVLQLQYVEPIAPPWFTRRQMVRKMGVCAKDKNQFDWFLFHKISSIFCGNTWVAERGDLNLRKVKINDDIRPNISLLWEIHADHQMAWHIYEKLPLNIAYKKWCINIIIW